MLNYEEFAAEKRKIHETNIILKKQLEAEKHRSMDLDEQIKILQKSEVDHETRSTLLEHELSDLRELTRNKKPDSVDLEGKLDTLRQQLTRADDELATANSKIQQTERLRQGLEQEASRYKVQIAALLRVHVLNTHHRINSRVLKICFASLTNRRSKRLSKSVNMMLHSLIHYTDRECG